MNWWRLAAASTSLGLILVGCAEARDPSPARSLEIGRRNEQGEFVPIDGAQLGVLLGTNGLDLFQLSLRAAEIDPVAPDPWARIRVGEDYIAGDVAGERADMVPDGTGYVLWDVRLALQTESCCVVCKEAEVDASLVDARGNRFAGSVRTKLVRAAPVYGTDGSLQPGPLGACPDSGSCCRSASMCTDPASAVVCE